MKYIVTFRERELEVDVERRSDGRFQVSVGDRSLLADLCGAGGPSLFSLLLDEQAFDLAVVRKDEMTHVVVGCSELSLLVESEQEHHARQLVAPASGGQAHTVKAPMPGIVTRILVREGDEIQQGTPLIILEAMKMENEVRAAHGGIVGAIRVKEGQTIDTGCALVSIG